MSGIEYLITVKVWNGTYTFCSIQDVREYFASVKAVCPCTFRINHCWFRKIHVRGRMFSFYDIDIEEPMY